MAESSGGDWLGLLGLIGAASIASAGAIYNNRAQEKLTKQVNSMAIDLADSAHQREVLDLYKAGLNPILSATGNGASVPSLGTPHLDNVLSDFGSSARAAGEMMSKQRSLSNEAVKLDNDAIRLSNKVASETVDSDIATAKAEAFARQKQADYDAAIAADKFLELNKWKVRISRDKHGNPVMDKNGRVVWETNPDYLKEVRDSVEAEVKEPGTRYLQSWIGTGGRAVGDAINGATGLKNFLRKQPKGIYNRHVDPRGRVSTSWTEYK